LWAIFFKPTSRKSTNQTQQHKRYTPHTHSPQAICCVPSILHQSHLAKAIVQQYLYLCKGYVNTTKSSKYVNTRYNTPNGTSIGKKPFFVAWITVFAVCTNILDESTILDKIQREIQMVGQETVQKTRIKAINYSISSTYHTHTRLAQVLEKKGAIQNTNDAGQYREGQ
jgi:hypothetical protein